VCCALVSANRPPWLDRAGEAREPVGGEGEGLQPRRLLAGHDDAERRRRREAEAPVVGRIADQQHALVPRPRGHVERAPDQRRADADRAGIARDGERPEEEARPRRGADGDRPVADGADDVVAGAARDELQLGDRRHAGPVAVGNL
jgi:hypothetical protein